MAKVTKPILLDSTGQNILQALINISNAIKPGSGGVGVGIEGTNIVDHSVTYDKLSVELQNMIKEHQTTYLADNEMGFCSHRSITKTGNTVTLKWRDPSEHTLWAKTVIVKKQGSYPENLADGIVVTTVNTSNRNQYAISGYVDTQPNNDIWFYRAFPVSVNNTVSYNELNKFGFWHYGFYIDRNDAVESTCVHPIKGLENENFESLHMNFTDNADTNSLFWGDWEDAPFMPKPCALKKSGIVDYYLDINDYSKKIDGTDNDNINNNLYDGDMMMEWPAIFTKVVTTDERISVYFCSEKYNNENDYECFSCLKKTPNANGTSQYSKNFYTAIYEGVIINSNLRSLSTGNIPDNSKYTFENETVYANAKGTGWTISTWADEDLIRCLGILVTGRLNVSKSIGYNCGYSTTELTHACGSGNTKGMFFGHYTTSPYATKFFGMENWYGHRARRVVGLIKPAGTLQLSVKLTPGTQDGSTGVEYNCTGSQYYTDSSLVLPQETNGSYIVDILGSRYGITIPKSLIKYTGDNDNQQTAMSGSDSTYYCDTVKARTDVLAPLIVGGHVGLKHQNGIFAFDVSEDNTEGKWYIGSSLSYREI